jgi:putative peptidoglycan lipid II flippase
MMAAALPFIDLVYRRGRFQFADSRETAVYFFWFALSLAFWSAQALYARAFYAAGDTLTPMVASTIITVAIIPVYGFMFRSMAVKGLAIASDIGIVANTLAMAVLLDRRKLVPAGILRWGELGKALVTAVAAGLLSFAVSRVVRVSGSRSADVYALILVTITWAAAVALGLWLTRSDLPRDLRRRKQTSYPRVAEKQAEMSGGIEP